MVMVKSIKQYGRRKKGLSEIEKQILKFIEKSYDQDGYPPSVREIADAVGVCSPATIYKHIDYLKKEGYVAKEDHKGRALKIVKKEDGTPIEYSKTYKKLTEVPHVKRVPARAPIFDKKNIEEIFHLPIDLVGEPQTFMLTVSDNSMIEAGIFEGDNIFVHMQDEANDGDKVVVKLDGNTEIRTYYKEKGNVRLQPENKEMEATIVKKSDLEGKIVGIVVGVFRKI